MRVVCGDLLQRNSPLTPSWVPRGNCWQWTPAARALQQISYCYEADKYFND